MARILLLLAALGASSLARASEGTLALDGGYEYTRDRETHFPASGYSASLSIHLGERMTFGTSFSELQTDPFTDPASGTTGRVEFDSFGASLGYGYPLSERTALGLGAGYATARTQGLDGFQANASEHSSGPTGSLSLNFLQTPRVRWSLGPSYSYVGRTPGWTGQAGLGLKLLRQLWFDASVFMGMETDGYSASLRMDFGPRN